MGESTLSSISHLLTMAEALKRKNKSLQGFIQFMQSQIPEQCDGSHESPYFRPLSDSMRKEGIPEGFELPPFPAFDDITDLGPHIQEISGQAAMLGATDTLKCILMIGTLKGEVLNWYINLPTASISGYPDLV